MLRPYGRGIRKVTRERSCGLSYAIGRRKDGGDTRAKNLVRILLKYALYFFIVVLISFFLPRLIPGSPLYTFAGEGTGDAEGLSASVLSSFESYYAPDLPLAEQFMRYFKNLAAGDLGISFFYKTSVSERVLSAARWTLLLSLSSLAIASVIGILLGTAMGLSAKGRGAFLLPPLLAVQAVPSFLTAAIAQMILAYRLRIFPAAGAVTPGMLPGQEGYWADVLAHLILPMLILIVSELPSITIFAYNSTLRVKKAPYAAFARYLCIEPGQIRRKFIIRNVMPDLLGKLNIQAVMCIMGAMFIEAVFSYPGLGQLLKNATGNRDYPLMQGILLISSLYGIAVNLVFELIINRTQKQG